MALRRTRLVRIEPVQEGNIKYPFQVLWGEDGPEGRVVIMIDKKGMGIRQALADHPSKNLYERMKLDDDTFKLVDYTTDDALTAREVTEIQQSTAFLKGSDIMVTDTTLIEQDI